MPTGNLFKELKEKPKKSEGKDFRIEIAQDFEKLKSESKAYFFLMKRISDMRDNAHYHVMLTAGEPVGSQWKSKLTALDEVLGIPEEFAQKGLEAEAEIKIRSVV